MKGYLKVLYLVPIDPAIGQVHKEWSEELDGLASIALHVPQLSYTAFTFGSWYPLRINQTCSHP